MVTTRGGTDTPGATPRSSAKRRIGKRELESLDTPTQAKRQRKAAPTPKKSVVEETPEPDVSAEESAQESVEEVSDTIAVALPSTDDAAEEPLPIRRRTSPKVVVVKVSPSASTVAESVEETREEDAPTPTQETAYHTPERQSGSVDSTPITKTAVDGFPTLKANATKNRTPASATRSGGRKKKAQKEDKSTTLEVTQTTTRFLDEIPSSTYESDQAPIPSQDAPAPSSQPKKAHMRFGSEEPTEIQDTIVITRQSHNHDKAPENAQDDVAPEPFHDSDEASDSDEAPDIVPTATAASKVALAQQEADRALKAQQLKDQAKRQKREARLAEEQRQKRIREETKAKKLARHLAKQQRATASAEDANNNAEKLRFRPDFDMATRHNLPALLPDALLATIDDQRPPTPPPQRRGKTDEARRKEKLNHHIKFLERSEKPVKDVRKGKLSVAVLGRQNRALPPKANRGTRNVREHWLKGRKVEKKKGGNPAFKYSKMERRARGGGGFLKGED